MGGYLKGIVIGVEVIGGEPGFGGGEGLVEDGLVAT